MNIAIIGSRDFKDYDLIVSEIEKLDLQTDDIKIVSGGARGADKLGEKYADNNNYEKFIFKPEWDRYGAGAGAIRNRQIIKESDIVIAFWDGESKGTKNSIGIAKKLNKRLIIVEYKNK